jgi:hypothetical protein
MDYDFDRWGEAMRLGLLPGKQERWVAELALAGHLRRWERHARRTWLPNRGPMTHVNAPEVKCKNAEQGARRNRPPSRQFRLRCVDMLNVQYVVRHVPTYLG